MMSYLFGIDYDISTKNLINFKIDASQPIK